MCKIEVTTEEQIELYKKYSVLEGLRLENFELSHRLQGVECSYNDLKEKYKDKCISYDLLLDKYNKLLREVE